MKNGAQIILYIFGSEPTILNKCFIHSVFCIISARNVVCDLLERENIIATRVNSKFLFHSQYLRCWSLWQITNRKAIKVVTYKGIIKIERWRKFKIIFTIVKICYNMNYLLELSYGKIKNVLNLNTEKSL